MRVCGGWIYIVMGSTPVFVPLDNEFINKEKKMNIGFKKLHKDHYSAIFW